MPIAPAAPAAAAAAVAPATPAAPAAPAAPFAATAATAATAAAAVDAAVDDDSDDDGLTMAFALAGARFQGQQLVEPPTMAPAASSVEERLEAEIASDMARVVAPFKAAMDQRVEDRHAAYEDAEAEAARMMDNGVNINPMLRQMDEQREQARQQEAEQ